MVWPGAKIEAIISLRKGVIFASRARLAMVIRGGVTYSVRFVSNEVEEGTNGISQAMTVELYGKVRVTGAYFSPTTSGQKVEEIVRGIVIYGSGNDVLIGELNARHSRWDTTTNAKGRALQKFTVGNRFDIYAPTAPTFSPRGRAGASIPDLMVTNMRGSSVRIVEEGRWEGASDHRPIVGVVEVQGEKGGEQKRKRVSKLAMRNLLKKKEVVAIYRGVEKDIVEKLKRATTTQKKQRS